MVSIQKNILAVGSIAIDTIETPNGNRDSVLGGSAMYFSLSASLFATIKLVGIVGNDYPQAGWDIFQSRKINIDNIQVVEGKTFRWGGRYSKDYRTRDTLFTKLGVFENFLPSINPKDLATPLVFLGNIHPDLQLSVAKQMKNAEYIVSDTMNLWIDISKNRLEKVLQISHVLLINHEEAEQYTGEKKIDKAAIALRSAGPRVVIIKMGADGAYLSYEDKSYYVPAFYIKHVIDPTGAGDSFAGGFMGYIAYTQSANYLEAVIAGSAVASFSVEGFGGESLLHCSKGKLNERIDAIKKMIKIKGISRWGK